MGTKVLLNSFPLNGKFAMKQDEFVTLIQSVKQKLKAGAFEFEDEDSDELNPFDYDSCEIKKTPDGMAIIEIVGSLSMEYSWWSGTSYKEVYHKLAKIREDDSIKGVLFLINSPGGEVQGLFELTDMIYEFSKPTYSYVSGLSASAAYAIAASTKRILGTEAAFHGSVGCMAVYTDFSKFWSEMGIQEIQFVSSQSPNKNLDPATEPGAAAVQKEIDQLADIFISKLAKYRNVTTQNVLDNFGKGACLISNDALKAGMIDGVGNIQAAITSMRTMLESNRNGDTGMTITNTKSEKDQTDQPVGEDDPNKTNPNAEGEDENLDAECEPGEMDASDDMEDQEEMTKEEEEKVAKLIQKNPVASTLLIKYGQSKENKRLQAIDNVGAKYPHNKKLLNEAKYGKKKMTAGDFAIKLLNEADASKQNWQSLADKDAGKIPKLGQDRGTESKGGKPEDIMAKVAASQSVQSKIKKN